MTFQSRIAAATRRVQADEASPEEQRRWAKRKSTHSQGQILFDGMTTPFPCVVRDISSTGVKLEMIKNKFNPEGGTSFLPNQFSLIMPLDRTRVECQSMWRRGSMIGARFMGAVSQLPAPQPSRLIRKK